VSAGLRVALAAGGVLGHALFSAAATLVLEALGLAGDAPTLAMDFLLRDLGGIASHLASLPYSLLWEWLLAHFPLSVAVLVAAFLRASRRPALVHLASVAAYVVAAFLTLRGSQEFGAYLLPLLWPAAAIVARATPAPVCVLLAVVGAADVSGTLRREGDDDRNEDLAALIVDDAGEAPIHLVEAHAQDVELALVWLPDAGTTQVMRLLKKAGPALPQLVHLVDDELDAELEAGAAVYFTESAREELLAEATRRFSPAGALFVEHLEARYDWRPIVPGDVLAWRLLPRGDDATGERPPR
jgi:hypothetical protein